MLRIRSSCPNLKLSVFAQGRYSLLTPGKDRQINRFFRRSRIVDRGSQDHPMIGLECHSVLPESISD